MACINYAGHPGKCRLEQTVAVCWKANKTVLSKHFFIPVRVFFVGTQSLVLVNTLTKKAKHGNVVPLIIEARTGKNNEAGVKTNWETTEGFPLVAYVRRTAVDSQDF